MKFMYQYLLGKVSTVRGQGVTLTMISINIYQVRYLRNNLNSTTRRQKYQYLLGKVSTIKDFKASRDAKSKKGINIYQVRYLPNHEV